MWKAYEEQSFSFVEHEIIEQKWRLNRKKILIGNFIYENILFIHKKTVILHPVWNKYQKLKVKK